MKRRFCCNRYKFYSIRNHYFNNGLLETDDPEIIRLVIHADGYNVIIHPSETKEELSVLKERGGYVEDWEIEGYVKPVEPEPEPTVEEESEPVVAVQGARGTASSKKQRKAQIIEPRG